MMADEFPEVVTELTRLMERAYGPLTGDVTWCASRPAESGVMARFFHLGTMSDGGFQNRRARRRSVWAATRRAVRRGMR